MKQKQTIKLNESQLRNIIKENIKKVLKEETDERGDAYDVVASLHSDIRTVIVNHLGSINDEDKAPYRLYHILKKFGEDNAKKGKEAIQMILKAEELLSDVYRHLNFGDTSDYFGRGYGSRSGAKATIGLSNPHKIWGDEGHDYTQDEF